MFDNWADPVVQYFLILKSSMVMAIELFPRVIQAPHIRTQRP